MSQVMELRLTSTKVIEILKGAMYSVIFVNIGSLPALFSTPKFSHEIIKKMSSATTEMLIEVLRLYFKFHLTK